jgi:hypothetical protein
MFLYNYINAIHPLVLQGDGKPPYNGYLIGVASGPGQLNQCSSQIPQGNPRQQIKNAGVPVIRVMIIHGHPLGTSFQLNSKCPRIYPIFKK